MMLTMILLPALAALVSALQTIVSRNADPFAPCLLSVTHVESGSTWNVTPENALLEGTVRTLRAEDRAMMRRRFHEVTEGTAAAHGVKADIEWFAGPPAVVNDASLCRLAREEADRCGFRVGLQEDTLGGEDYSLYLDKAPGIFIRVDTGGGYPGHHPKSPCIRRLLILQPTPLRSWRSPADMRSRTNNHRILHLYGRRRLL